MRKNHLLISYSSGHPVKDTLFTMAQYVFTMNRVGKIVPPKRQILKDISLSFFPGAKIGLLTSPQRLQEAAERIGRLGLF